MATNPRYRSRYVLSVRSSSCAAVVNICGGSWAGCWGGPRPWGPGPEAPCPCGGASDIKRFSIIRRTLAERR